MVQNHYPCVTERKTFEVRSCRACPLQPVGYQLVTIMHMHCLQLQLFWRLPVLQHQFRRCRGSVWYFLSACRLSACCSKGQSSWGWKWQWASPWQVPVMHRACTWYTDQSTHGGSSQPSSFTEKLTEAHNFNSWAGWRVVEKSPCCLAHGQKFAELGKGELFEFLMLSLKEFQSTLKVLPWLWWWGKKQKKAN